MGFFVWVDFVKHFMINNQIRQYNWSISYSRTIDCNIDKIWNIISMRSNLEAFHPFCKINRVVVWPGKGSVDEIEYLNGLIFKRKFTNWIEKEGYDLNVATYNDLAEKSKVNKELVTYDRANAAATGDKINIILSSLDESELNSLTNEELKRLGGQDLVNRVAKFKQGGGESSADPFGFSTMPLITIEKIANQDRQSLLDSYGQEFVDALVAELTRRDEQK